VGFDEVLIYQNDNLKIHQLLLNRIQTNCFIVQKESEAILVDPVSNANAILDYLDSKSLVLRFMLSTHGHFDHIGAAADIIESGLVEELFIHEKEFGEVSKAPMYSALILKEKLIKPKLSRFSNILLKCLDSFGLSIEHAGGHTKGSCFLYSHNKEFVITGDLALNHNLKITLANSRENKNEFFEFVKNIEDNFLPHTVIFPGHGDRTTVKDELMYNEKWKYIRESQNGN